MTTEREIFIPDRPIGIAQVMLVHAEKFRDMYIAEIPFDSIEMVGDYDEENEIILVHLKSGLAYYVRAYFVDFMAAWEKYKEEMWQLKWYNNYTNGNT